MYPDIQQKTSNSKIKQINNIINTFKSEIDAYVTTTIQKVKNNKQKAIVLVSTQT